MGNVYFLLIEKLIEKGNKNVIEENINKIAYKINTEKDEEMKSQYEFISQILQKKKIKYELTNKDKTKEKGKDNYSPLIQDILNENFVDTDDKEIKSNYVLDELKKKIQKSLSISSDENSLIKKEIKNENKSIKKKALEISVNLIKKGKMIISNDTFKNLIESINIPNDNNKLTSEEEKNIQDIIIDDYSSQLIKEYFNKKENIELDENLKSKLQEGLKNQDKSTRNNLLSVYSKIKNIQEEEMKSSMELLSKNINYENDRNLINESVNVLNNFINQNNQIKINDNLINGLLDYISINDYEKYTEEDEEYDKEFENKKNFIEKIKDGVNKEVMQKLKEILNNNDKETQKELIKHFKSKNWDITKPQLLQSQKEKLLTTNKVFECIDKIISQTNTNLSRENFNNIEKIFESCQNNEKNSENYNKILKEKIIDTIGTIINNKKEIKLPNELVNNLSNEINSSKQNKILNILDKVSDNQELQTIAKKNLFNILEDNIDKDENSLSNDSDITKKYENYEMAYKILKKSESNLNDNQRTVLKLEENIQIINKNIEEDKIGDNLDNINNIINNGYSLNEYSKQSLNNLITKKNIKENLFEKSVNIFNNLAKNSIDIGNEALNTIMKRIQQKNSENKLSKSSMKLLMSCLINIIENCKVPNGCVKTFEECLKQYKNNEINSEINLIVKGLLILSEKNYSLNVEEIDICLDIIETKKIDEKTILELSKALEKMFNQVNIQESTFTKLFKIMIKNEKIFEILSQCLLNSFKFKSKKDIINIIKINIKNIEELIKSHRINDNMKKIIFSVEKKIYLEIKSEIISDFYDFINYCKHPSNLEEDQYKIFGEYINKYGIDKKYFDLFYYNFDISFQILKSFLHKNKKYIKYLNYYSLFENRIQNTTKALDIIINNFDSDKINQKVIDILLNLVKTNDKDIYIPLKKIFELIYNDKNKIKSLPQEFINIINIEIEAETNFNNFKSIKNYIEREQFIPERYFTILFHLTNNKNEKDNYTLKYYVLNLLIFTLNKGCEVTDEIIKYFINEKNINTIFKSINMKSNPLNYICIIIESIILIPNLMKRYSEIIINYFNSSNETIGTIILNLKEKSEFKNINNNIREIIINKIHLLYQDIFDYKLILHWIYSSMDLTEQENNIVLNGLKKTNFDNLYNIENLSNEEKLAFLEDENLIYNKLKELSNNRNENKNELKLIVLKLMENNSNSKKQIIKLLLLLSFQKIRNNLSFDNIKSILGKYILYEDIDNVINFFEQNNNSNSLYLIRKKWIKKIFQKKQINEEIYKDNEIFINNIEDNCIELLLEYNNINDDFKKIMIFFKNNKNLEKDLIILLNNAIKNIPNNKDIGTLINKLSIEYLKNKINFPSENTKDYETYVIFILAFINSNWSLNNICEFFNSKINLKRLNNDFLKRIIIPIIVNNKILFDSKNIKNENLISIFKKYDEDDLELMIKDLAIEQKLKGIDENNLETMIEQLRNKNNSKLEENLLIKVKGLIEKTRYCFNSKSKSGISNKRINQYLAQDILDWRKSEITIKLINKENFLPEAMAVIDRALEIITNGHRIRNVQLASIFLILTSPKNRGLLLQIKTGEGKSNIVAAIAIIKALQFQFVDILSSSIVLAKRDAEEKKNFYKLFDLTCSNAEETKSYNENIIYGDTLSFEGDIIKMDFHGYFARNPEREFRCLIIDEADSTGLDNLGSSTRLSAPFPSYDYLNILYPFIYNSLISIDNCLDNGFFGEISLEKREEFVCEKLKISVEEYLNINKNTEFKVIIPENLKKFIQLQIPKWCKQAYKAKHYFKLNYDYVIGKRKFDEKERESLKEKGLIPREFNRICPVDYINTGVVNESMVWSDGLTQFLEVKHGLKITPEDLTTTFLSHYTFIRKYITEKYGNNIYGVTGTLGKESSHDLLKELFEVDAYIIPPFRPSRLNILEGKTNFQDKEQWKKCVIDNILHNTIKLNRTVLIISLTIEDSNELYDELEKKSETKKYNLRLFKYQRNDSEANENGNQLKLRYSEREVIFATNLAGRGTDIGLTEIVGKNGGMHVIVTFIPSNSRIEEQAFGRTARSGARGSTIIIANEKKDIKELIYKRDIKEDERIDKIKNKELKKIKIKSQLFDKFTSFYRKMKNFLNILKVFGLPQSMADSILKDAEEKWGIWLMENCEEKKEDINENDIYEKYRVFEKDLANNYMKINLEEIEFQNPMNYISGELFNKGYIKSKDLCFYGNYLNILERINGEKDYNIKNEAINIITQTANYIEGNMIPQLGGIEIITTQVKNYYPIINKNEFSIDIENKMNSLQKLRNILEENKNKIKSILNNEKAKIYIHYKNIQNITKFKECIEFFQNSGILYYGEISIEIEKDWFGIFFTIFLGVCEIVAGSLLSGIGLGSIGIDLMNEGIEDIKYGFECLIGEKEFSWKELGNRKMAFVIKVITSYTLKWIFKGFKNPFKNADLKNSTDYFNLVKKKAVEIGTKKLVSYTINKCLSPKFFETIVKKLKQFSKYISKNFFENKLKDILLGRYKNQIKQMLILDHLSDMNAWKQVLNVKMKMSLQCLSRILGIVVKTILNLLNSLFKNDSWENKLIEIFENLVECGIDELKKALENSLYIAKDTFLEIFKGFEQKAIKGVQNVLYTFDDIFGKAMNIPNMKELTNILIDNNVINKLGEINGKLLFNDKNYKPKINFRFPMDISFNNDFTSNIIDKIPKINSDFLIGGLNGVSDDIKNIININNIYEHLFDNFDEIDNLFSIKEKDISKILNRLNNISDNISKIANIDTIYDNLNQKFIKFKDIYSPSNTINIIQKFDSN